MVQRLIGPAALALGLVLLALIFYAHAVGAAASPPRDVTVVWNSRISATMSWQQTSDANYVCLSKVDKNQTYTALNCYYVKNLNRHSVLVQGLPPTDARAFPNMGDKYYLTEYLLSDTGPQQTYGTYGPYDMIWQVHLPAAYSSKPPTYRLRLPLARR